jgi:hypothetical protein
MPLVTAFLEDEIIARGEAAKVTQELERLHPADLGAIRAFEDGSGRIVDLDFWGAAASAPPPPPRPRGRPSLGVAAREVTLLPRHWEWLAGQPGGASAALRRLVEDASRRAPAERDRSDAVYRFLSQMCGDRPGYEEALRALYRGDQEALRSRIAAWPKAIGDYVEELLG